MRKLTSLFLLLAQKQHICEKLWAKTKSARACFTKYLCWFVNQVLVISMVNYYFQEPSLANVENAIYYN